MRVLVKWALLLFPIIYIWLVVIKNLQVEWETNAQYSYGYIVPFLCVGLILQRWHAGSESRKQKAESGNLTRDNRPLTTGAGNEGRETKVQGLAGETPALPVEQTSNAQRSTSHGGSHVDGRWSRAWGLLLLVGLAMLAMLYLPTRLIELAVPEWRPIQWALGFIAVGLTLGGIYLYRGKSALKLFAFPLCFFLVAIPWPTPIEQPVIQTLTRFNAAMVIEVMGVMGIPALQHGNVIEVGTGVVGIDEACSGIRSFQSSLMIALFLGALYQLRLRWRILFVVIGFVMAMLLNVVRTSFLTYVAAKEGVAAIDEYHDPAGLWIMVGCTLGLWGVGLVMRGKKQGEGSGERGAVSQSKVEIEKTESSLKAESGNLTTEHGTQTTGAGERGAENKSGSTPHPTLSPVEAERAKAEKQGSGSQSKVEIEKVESSLKAESGKQKIESGEQKADAGLSISAFSFQLSAFSLALTAWLVFVEVGSQVWYRVREARSAESPKWSLRLPVENPTFRELPMAAKTLDLLRFDDGKQGAWTETDGSRWQAFYFNWRPGRVAGYLAKRHTPEACMPATGREMLAGPELLALTVKGLELPMRRYRFGSDGNALHVFHCRWEAGAGADSFVEQESTRLNLVRAIWNGRGKAGQKVIEVIISGTEDPEEATARLKEWLGEMIEVERARERQKAEILKAERAKDH